MKAKAGCMLGIDNRYMSCTQQTEGGGVMKHSRVQACSDYRTKVNKQDVKRAEKVIVKEEVSEIALIQSMPTKENAEKYFKIAKKFL